MKKGSVVFFDAVYPVSDVRGQRYHPINTETQAISLQGIQKITSNTWRFVSAFVSVLGMVFF